MLMLTLAAVILTKNEAFHIADCIAAVKPYVSAVYVLDSESEDATRQSQASMVPSLRRPFDNYAAQRQAALARIEAQWLLFVDANERVTPALAKEMGRWLRTPNRMAIGFHGATLSSDMR